MPASNKIKGFNVPNYNRSRCVLQKADTTVTTYLKHLPDFSSGQIDI